MRWHCSTLRVFVWLLVAACLVSSCRKKASSVQPIEAIEEYHSFVPYAEPVNQTFGGYYVALPPRYNERVDSFPLLLFLHGLGQMGNGNSDLHYITFDGIGKLIDDGKFPVSFASQGRLYSFIVVSPQSGRIPSADDVKQLLDQVKTKFRVDTNRIYLAGLSMGGRIVTVTAAEYPEEFAAIVPMAGVATGSGTEERCKRIAEANLPLWEFHNVDDPMAPLSQAKYFINTLGSFKPAIKPRFTIFDVYGHDAWTTALDPNYRENGMNIYEWMLQYTRR